MRSPPGPTSASDGGVLATTPCPQCKAPTIRIARRQVDRLSTSMLPTRRYRCQSFQCQWEGNVRLKRAALARSAPRHWEGDRTPSSVSRVFLLSMALALAGITFILISTYTDWLEPGGFLVSTATSPTSSPNLL